MVGAGAVALLDALHAAGIRTALVSNCSASVASTLAASGLRQHLDEVVLSCDVGAVKPEPAIFQAAVSRLGVPPASAMYVADGQHGELEAAASLGMLPVRVGWSDATGTAPAGADEVHGLDEVAALLGVDPARPGAAVRLSRSGPPR